MPDPRPRLPLMASERITLTVPGPDGDRELGLSSPNRVLWPELGITKHELAEYMLSVSGPFITANGDRPVSLERFPEGVGGADEHDRLPPVGLARGRHRQPCRAAYRPRSVRRHRVRRSRRRRTGDA